MGRMTYDAKVAMTELDHEGPCLESDEACTCLGVVDHQLALVASVEPARAGVDPSFSCDLA